MAWRSERYDENFRRNDIYYFSSESVSLGDNELTVHGDLTRIGNADGTPRGYTPDPTSQIYIGVQNRKEDGGRWVRMPVEEIDNLVLALLAAKKLAQNPELRPVVPSEIGG